MTRLTAPVALTGLMLLALSSSAEAGVVGRSFDAITTPGHRVQVQAKFQCSWFGGLWKPDLKNKRVELAFRGRTLRARTDHEGMGRASFDAPTQPGTYTYTARYRSTQVSGKVWVLDPQRPLAVFDIDGTLSDMSDFMVLFRGASAKQFPGSSQLVRDMARTHQIIYLTARDDFLDKQTREFLSKQNFPVAPVIYNDYGASGEVQLSLILPSGHGDFKLGQLKKLQRLGLNVAVGVGNAETDGYAYEHAHVPSYLRTTKSGTGFRFQTTDQLRAQLVADGHLAPAATPGLAGAVGSHP